MIRVPSFLPAAVLLLAALPAWAEPGGVVVARQQVTVSRGTVRLSDLFSGLGAAQDREIGPAPAPGHSITVPEPQLAAIATQFGVDWMADPDMPPIVLRRAGRTISPDEVLAVLSPALGAGSTPDGQARITLFPFAGPTLPAESHVAPEITRLDPPGPDGRFSATLAYALADADPVTLHVSGRVEQMVRAVVLTRGLAAGAVIGPGDIRLATIDRGHSVEPPLLDPTQAIGFPLSRPVPAGTPLSANLLDHPPTIARNHPVVLRLDQGGLSLTATGVALESGTLGGTIRVLNAASHAVLLGQVVDGNDVRIIPGSTPVSASAVESGRNGRIS